MKNNVQIEAKYIGSLKDVDEGLEGALESEIKRLTGLAANDVSFAKGVQYKVSLQADEGEKRYTGTSKRSIEAAISSATKKGKLSIDEEAAVQASVERTAEVPYFTVPVVARSTNLNNLHQYLADGFNQLASTYAGRLGEVDSHEFKVIHTKKNYHHDGMLPKGDFGWLERKFSVVRTGESDISMDDAVEKAKIRSKKVKSTVYEATSHIVIYGHAEESVELENGVALPMIVTSSTTSPIEPMAPPTAAKDLAPLPSMNALM